MKGASHQFLRREAMLELTVADLDAVDGEPRIFDLVLADRLGFTRPRTIRQLIERSMAELESFGLIAARCSAYRNRQFTEYWLNEPQALLVCLFSRTEKAAEVRRTVIAVFSAWRRGQLAPTRQPTDLSRAQLKAINSRAYALASEEIRTAFQKHQTRLLREARDLLAAGRSITLLENKETPE
jgi:hypothetical protein